MVKALSPAAVDIENVAKYFMNTVHRLYTCSLHPQKYDQDWAVRLRTPQVGDMVAEITAYFAPASRRIGKLISLTEEPYPYENWDEAYEGRPIPTRPIYTIEALNGKAERWENCHFLSLPETYDFP